MNVTLVDWLILASLFAALLSMAIYVNTFVRSVADFVVSGRKVRVWLGMGAGIAGEIGLVSIVATCEQGYLRGYAFVLIGIMTQCILLPLFGIFGFGIERFRATKAMTVPQYVEMRYSRRLRILTGILNSAAGVLQMLVFPIVGANFVRVLIKAPEFIVCGGYHVQTAWIIMAVLLTCAVIFTYFGGYITLTVTNFFQMIIIMGVLYWLFCMLVYDMGLQAFWTGLETAKGKAGVYPCTGEKGSYGVIWFLWLLIMSILLQFSYGPYLQKYASMDRPRTVRLSALLGGLFGSGRTFVILGLGVLALVSMGSHAPSGISVSEKVWQSMATPYYLSGVVPPILMGFLLAGLLFADISTTDQYILSWSTSIVNDCIYPFKKTPFTPKQHITAVKTTIFVLCVLFFIFGIFYKPTMPLWEYMWLCANIIGGTGIAVLFGMYWKRATTPGAYAAVLVCVILPLLDLIARRVYVAVNVEFPFEPHITGFWTYVIAVGMLIIVSLLSKEKSKYWDLGKTVREMNIAKDDQS